MSSKRLFEVFPLPEDDGSIENLPFDKLMELDTPILKHRLERLRQEAREERARPGGTSDSQEEPHTEASTPVLPFRQEPQHSRRLHPAFFPAIAAGLACLVAIPVTWQLTERLSTKNVSELAVLAPSGHPAYTSASLPDEETATTLVASTETRILAEANEPRPETKFVDLGPNRTLIGALMQSGNLSLGEAYQASKQLEISGVNIDLNNLPEDTKLAFYTTTKNNSARLMLAPNAMSVVEYACDQKECTWTKREAPLREIVETQTFVVANNPFVDGRKKGVPVSVLTEIEDVQRTDSAPFSTRNLPPCTPMTVQFLKFENTITGATTLPKLQHAEIQEPLDHCQS